MGRSDDRSLSSENPAATGITLQELYMLIGEREVIRFLQQLRIEELERRVRELEHGELVKSANNNPV